MIAASPFDLCTHPAPDDNALRRCNESNSGRRSQSKAAGAADGR